MATKKIVKKAAVKKIVAKKKTTVAYVPPPLDKKNAKAFADFIFHDEKGVVSFLKLCDGTLQNGKVGGRTTHCAVGEAFHTFVDSSLKKVLNKDHDYESKYGPQPTDEEDNDLIEGPTAAAIDALIDVAKLKNNTAAGKCKFAQALNTCVGENDNIIGDGDNENYFNRARHVAETWLNNVVPLLK